MNKMTLAQYNTLTSITLVLGTILLISSPASADQDRPARVDARAVTVNGIKLGDSESLIKKKLGNPNKIESGYSEAITKNTKYLYYNGLTIYLADDEMLNLSCAESCITGKGIKIGSTIKQVFDAYGVAENSKEKASYVFWIPGGYIDAYLIFHFKNGVVNKIEYWVDYV